MKKTFKKEENGDRWREWEGKERDKNGEKERDICKEREIKCGARLIAFVLVYIEGKRNE